MAESNTFQALGELFKATQQQIALQQKQIELMMQRNEGHEGLVDALAKTCSDFSFDPENGITFEDWYRRHEDIIRIDGKSLSDDAKVRLLLRKLDAISFSRYSKYILPKSPRDNNFETTVKILKEIFVAPMSIFSKRWKCLQVDMNETEDFIDYMGRVNQLCEDFQFNTLTLDSFKALIFVLGLKNARFAEIRTRLLHKLDSKTEGVTLSYLLEEAKRLSNLKKDSALVGSSEGSNTPPASVKIVKKFTKPKFNNKKSSKTSTSHDPPKDTPRTPCWFCGNMHFSRDCTFKQHKCKACGIFGHKDGYCQSASRAKKKHVSRSNVIRIVNCTTHETRRFIDVSINSQPVALQYDSASDLTIVSKQLWRQIGSPALLPSEIKVKDAQFNSMKILEWIQLFDLWSKPANSFCRNVEAIQSGTFNKEKIVKQLKDEFQPVFDSGLGLCTKATASLKLKEGAKPIFRPKRPVPYPVMAQVEDELQRLEQKGIIKPVTSSEWAAPIVVARKANGSVRICGDYSTGLNQVLEDNKYPIPTPDDIFQKLASGKIFSNIDLSDAYLQIPVDEDSQKLLIIHTHRGLYHFTRLAPGVSVAPGQFQCIVEGMLSGIDNVAVYFDDICVSGPDINSHISTVKQVLQRLQDYGFHIKLEKCNFFQTQVKQDVSIKYLGHILDCHGLRPDPGKIAAIKDMPPPKDISQLRSFLGAINYYCKFVKSMSTLRAPFDSLLRDGAPWIWGEDCQRAFMKFKDILSSDLLLTHFDPSLPISIAADASNTGIGACIYHTYPDGSEKVISHASRTLSPAERNYSQIEKEGLALVFGVTKFHRYIFGRRFTLFTDHKPLLSIFGSKKGIPLHSANRLQRWALTLLSYTFDIKFISTSSFGHADVLSRLINTHSKPDEEFIIACTELERDVATALDNGIHRLPLTFKVVSATQKCSTLQAVKEFVVNGWPPSKSHIKDREVQSYYQYRDCLTLIKDCLIYRERLVVPHTFRKKVLHTLHEAHPGQQRMLSLARSFVFWPGIDGQIRTMVRECEDCALACKAPTKSPLCPWPKSNKPWQRIHMDFAQWKGENFLLINDSFSKWPEIIQMKSTTAEATISVLLEIFSRFGNPELIVSDNGTQFTSGVFKQLCQSRGIQHERCSPYHPQSNGQVERFVDTLKRSLRKMENEGSLKENLCKFLHYYRSTPNPNSHNGLSPAEAFIGRKIRTNLSLLIPKEGEQEEKQPDPIDLPRVFQPKEKIYAKHFTGNTSFWVPGEIIEKVGAVMYNVLVQLKSGRIRLIRSHVNQIKKRYSDTSQDCPIPTDLLLDDGSEDEQMDVDEEDSGDRPQPRRNWRKPDRKTPPSLRPRPTRRFL
ncbi:uncharacterized protein K02A2.6-like [Phlebotomus papatasi]|uniref:uncharacterized protein K02A2.6-like n=1 Tax=Phlebotomus papatasi TaxID=29031 RepID=UPI0024836B90|nr:uncharacterized protein K02A2.6-like [Phlebotomus papatasi]